MYPERELTRLALHKATLRRDIAFRRMQSSQAAARVAQPFERLDRLLTWWRQLWPLAKFAAVPLGLLLQRNIFPRRKILGSLVRWGPLLLGALRGFRAAAKPRAGISVSSPD